VADPASSPILHEGVLAGRLSSESLGSETIAVSEANCIMMLYLEVFPVFGFYLLVMGIVTLIAGLTRTGSLLYPYLWRVLLSSAVGVLIADALLWSIVVASGGLLTATNASDQARQVVGVLSPLGPILQPLPISFIGASVGIAVGVIWAVRAIRQSS
jgi:hypothetical protein